MGKKDHHRQKKQDAEAGTSPTQEQMGPTQTPRLRTDEAPSTPPKAPAKRDDAPGRQKKPKDREGGHESGAGSSGRAEARDGELEVMRADLIRLTQMVGRLTQAIEEAAPTAGAEAGTREEDPEGQHHASQVRASDRKGDDPEPGKGDEEATEQGSDLGKRNAPTDGGTPMAKKPRGPRASHSWEEDTEANPDFGASDSGEWPDRNETDEERAVQAKRPRSKEEERLWRSSIAGVLPESVFERDLRSRTGEDGNRTARQGGMSKVSSLPNLKELPRFDKFKDNFRNHVRKVEAFADLNDYSPSLKLRAMKLSLTGSDREYLEFLEPEILEDYAELVGQLMGYFDPYHGTGQSCPVDDAKEAAERIRPPKSQDGRGYTKRNIERWNDYVQRKQLALLRYRKTSVLEMGIGVAWITLARLLTKDLSETDRNTIGPAFVRTHDRQAFNDLAAAMQRLAGRSTLGTVWETAEVPNTKTERFHPGYQPLEGSRRENPNRPSQPNRGPPRGGGRGNDARRGSLPGKYGYPTRPPAKGAMRCYNCGELGHIASQCTEPRRPTSREVKYTVHTSGSDKEEEDEGESRSENDREDVYRDQRQREVKKVLPQETGKPEQHANVARETIVRGSLEDEAVSIELDTGANVSLVSETWLRRQPAKIQKEWKEGGETLLDAQGNKSMRTSGQLRGRLAVGQQTLTHTFLVMKGLTQDVLLGTDAFQVLQLSFLLGSNEKRTEDGRAKATRQEAADQGGRQRDSQFEELVRQKLEHLEEDERLQWRRLLSSYRDAFWVEGDKLGLFRERKIDVPFSVEGLPNLVTRRPRFSGLMSKQVEAHVREMQKLDIIRKISDPLALSPMLLVVKGNGSYRPVQDYREQNKRFQKYPHPIPHQISLFEATKGAEYFSTADMAQGFHQVGISDDLARVFAFTTDSGTYCYTRLPMGAKISPNVFQEVMDFTLEDVRYKFVVCYIDDLLVYSRTADEHRLHFEEVLKRLKNQGLKLKLEKCFFQQPRVDFLGHSINAKGITPLLSKVEGIERMARPTKPTEVRQFLGMVGYYRDFIPHFALHSEPLVALTRKNARFVWTTACQRAFDFLRTCLIKKPILLAVPDYDKPFRLYTDGSMSRIGAILAQENPQGKEHIVHILSKKLRLPKHPRDPHHFEAYAIYWAVKKLRPYLLGTTFTVVTDHKPLVQLMSTKEPTGRKAKWIAYLMEYDLTIEYRPGKHHANVDALTRGPRTDDEETVSESQPEAHRRVQQILRTVISTAEDLQVALFEGQRTDPEIGRVLQMLGESPKLQEDFEAIGGILYQKRQDENRRLVIPQSLRKMVMRSLHDDALTGSHLGTNRMQRLIGSRYYWPRMHQEVADYVRSCPTCQKHPHQKPSHKDPEKFSLLPTSPMEVIVVDVVGPFPVSKSGNKYALVLYDAFSSWPEAIPLTSLDSQDMVSLVFEQFLTRNMCPRFIVSDGARYFTAEHVRELYGLLNIEGHVGSPYTHGSTATVERFIRTLEGMIKKYVNEEQTDWDVRLQSHLAAYRVSVNPDTGFSPFYLWFGREPILPTDLLLPGTEGSARFRSAGSFVQHLLTDFRKDLLAAKESKELQVRHRWTNNQRTALPFQQVQPFADLAPGTMVYRHYPRVRKGRSKKLSEAWTGPLQVVKQHGPRSYQVELTYQSADGSTKTRKLFAHRRHLKLAHERVLDTPASVKGLAAPPGTMAPAIVEETSTADSNHESDS